MVNQTKEREDEERAGQEPTVGSSDNKAKKREEFVTSLTVSFALLAVLDE